MKYFVANTAFPNLPSLHRPVSHTMHSWFLRHNVTQNVTSQRTFSMAQANITINTAQFSTLDARVFQQLTESDDKRRFEAEVADAFDHFKEVRAAVFGPSKSGKSTFVKAATGITNIHTSARNNPGTTVLGDYHTSEIRFFDPPGLQICSVATVQDRTLLDTWWNQLAAQNIHLAFLLMRNNTSWENSVYFEVLHKLLQKHILTFFIITDCAVLKPAEKTTKRSEVQEIARNVLQSLHLPISSTVEQGVTTYSPHLLYALEVNSEAFVMPIGDVEINIPLSGFDKIQKCIDTEFLYGLSVTKSLFCKAKSSTKLTKFKNWFREALVVHQQPLQQQNKAEEVFGAKGSAFFMYCMRNYITPESWVHRNTIVVPTAPTSTMVIATTSAATSTIATTPTATNADRNQVNTTVIPSKFEPFGSTGINDEEL
jgi:GTP-binding protein EngB required for normal cell division